MSFQLNQRSSSLRYSKAQVVEKSTSIKMFRNLSVPTTSTNSMFLSDIMKCGESSRSMTSVDPSIFVFQHSNNQRGESTPNLLAAKSSDIASSKKLDNGNCPQEFDSSMKITPISTFLDQFFQTIDKLSLTLETRMSEIHVKLLQSQLNIEGLNRSLIEALQDGTTTTNPIEQRSVKPKVSFHESTFLTKSSSENMWEDNKDLLPQKPFTIVMKKSSSSVASEYYSCSED